MAMDTSSMSFTEEKWFERISHKMKPTAVDESPHSQAFQKSWTTAQDGSAWFKAHAGRGPPIAHLSPLERALNAEYQNLRKSDYHCYCLDLAIWPATSFVADMVNGMSSIQVFCFGYSSWDTPHVAPVQLITSVDSTPSILVRHNGEWKSLLSFLTTCIRNPHPSTSFPILREMWDSNGKSFPLESLPAELRENIYHKAFTHGLPPTATHPQIFPYRYAEPSRKTSRFGAQGYVPTRYRPNLGLFFTNKRVYAEASHLLYTTSIWHFTPAEPGRGLRDPFSAFLKTLHPIDRAKIRFVELHYTHKELLKLFGARLSKKYNWVPADGPLLMRKERLGFRRFGVTFPPACEMLRYEWLWDPDMGCQTQVVEWILSSMRGFVGHLDEGAVALEGHVRGRQKEAFLEGLRGQREIEMGEVERKVDAEGVEDGNERVDGAFGAEVGVDLMVPEQMEFAGAKGDRRPSWIRREGHGLDHWDEGYEDECDAMSMHTEDEVNL
ncbi:hypothetical protein K402DRAFT_451408 [Aulographum hederae CBS 113979]|uniref:Uncharacterized protein n=1 Tax=Aulographum hederae CBS 113979 TaxID=1176131 RepID=A0A6G1HBQ8_9PEZI|nr:hypothetical protein K402DRAFT_451408 [Aulographum hederae CBS 113979]